MHYLYVLEGRLKYETISFDSSVVFNLYNKNVERKDENIDSDDLTYFLKSDIEVVITVNLAGNTISLSAPLSQTILLFDQSGNAREIKAEKEISLAENVVKFKIADVDFSFLINSMNDPETKSVSALNVGKATAKTSSSKFSLGAIDLGSLNKATVSIIAVVMLFIMIAMFVLSPKKDSYIATSVVFNNESDLMRANLQGLNSNEILVKTQLMELVKLYLEQQGHSYVKFDLEKQGNGKFNLLLFVFLDEAQSFDTMVNQFTWMDSVIVQVIDMKQMIDDFNRLAEKYGLKTLDRNQTNMLHQLIEVSFVNNNLKFDSLQRDLHTFYGRWGKNYIEFNVSLKKHQELPVDFILKGSGEEVVKSAQGFYIN